MAQGKQQLDVKEILPIDYEIIATRTDDGQNPIPRALLT